MEECKKLQTNMKRNKNWKKRSSGPKFHWKEMDFYEKCIMKSHVKR